MKTVTELKKPLKTVRLDCIQPIEKIYAIGSSNTVFLHKLQQIDGRWAFCDYSNSAGLLHRLSFSTAAEAILYELRQPSGVVFEFEDIQEFFDWTIRIIR